MLAVLHGLPGAAVVKKIYLQMQELQETQVNPEVKKGPGGGNGSVLAWSNPMDRGAWWATVHGVGIARSDTIYPPSTHTHIQQK